jgi:hypothetical protein
MSSIVTSILDSTVGLLWNKARDSTAAKLKDGDITDAKIREILVRDLNDIKSKLDGLSRKDLLSSYSFLQEGVDFLNSSLNKSKLEEIRYDQCHSSTLMACGVEILNEALQLSHATEKIKTCSNKQFDSAKKRFEEARKMATQAFWNEALSINDRIFAAKVRIISEMLECLDHPEIAITGCLSFLMKLHSLPTIQETFSVYLNKGLKSILNKSERVENVKSVMFINYVLFQYVSKFSSKYFTVFAWPTIDLVDRSFHPVLNWLEVSRRTSMEKELPSQPPNELSLFETNSPNRLLLAVINGHGDVIVGESNIEDNTNFIRVISKSGQTKQVKLPVRIEDEVMETQYILSLAVDNDNRIYIATRHERRRKNDDVERKYLLYVLDANCNVKNHCCLGFLREEIVLPLKTSLTTTNNIIIGSCFDSHVYVCDNTGKLKHVFERNSGWLRSLSVSAKNEIIISSGDSRAVYMYSEKGSLNWTIELPEGDEVVGVAYHYVICKIIVLSYSAKNDSLFLQRYTDEEGELESTTFVCKRESNELPELVSHPNGPAAIVRKESITFI